jgi:Regulator of chromosome condensation (RCC1) repeat
VALTSDGAVVAWGDNFYGQTNVPAGLSGVTAIAAGDVHTVALTSDGAVVARGFNDFGQTNVPEGLSGVTASKSIACGSSAPSDDIEQTVAAGASSLSYDAATGQYSYVWKTDKAWGGTYRQLIVRLADGADHIANFTFTKYQAGRSRLQGTLRDCAGARAHVMTHQNVLDAFQRRIPHIIETDTGNTIV